MPGSVPPRRRKLMAVDEAELKVNGGRKDRARPEHNIINLSDHCNWLRHHGDGRRTGAFVGGVVLSNSIFMEITANLKYQ